MGDALSPLVTLSKVLLCAIRHSISYEVVIFASLFVLSSLRTRETSPWFMPLNSNVGCIPRFCFRGACRALHDISGMTLTLTNLADINIDTDIDNYIDKSGWLPLTMTAYSSGHVSCVWSDQASLARGTLWQLCQNISSPGTSAICHLHGHCTQLPS